MTALAFLLQLVNGSRRAETPEHSPTYRYTVHPDGSTTKERVQ